MEKKHIWVHYVYIYIIDFSKCIKFAKIIFLTNEGVVVVHNCFSIMYSSLVMHFETFNIVSHSVCNCR